MRDYGTFLKTQFPDFKVQKISIHAGFSCPNRDGTVGVGGCTYCNNQTFNPDYCTTDKSITQQLEEGKKFFSRKYPSMKYLAYFQAYTNTYDALETLKSKYEEALSVPDVVGLVIGTRPDCMPDDLLAYLSELNKRTFLIIEYGVESTNEKTLIRINRGHSFQCAKETIIKTAGRGIKVGIHMILGLPGENHDDLMQQADEIANLPITTLKLHQLQIIKGTKLAKEYELHPEDFHIFTAEEYIDLVLDYLDRLPQDLVVERFVSQSPKNLLIAPDWGLKNHEFADLVEKRKRSRMI